MRSEGSRRANLGTRGRRRGGATPQSAASPVPRPGDGTSRERDDPSPLRSCLLPLDDHAVAASAPKRNSLPSTQRRCSTQASLRARATLARRMPRRFATSRPQRLRVENLPALVSITFAASYSAVRTIASPALLIPPVTSVSPDWYFFGVSPKCAPTARERRNRAGSSTAELKVTATRAPTPGTVISRRQTASSRTIASTARCRAWDSRRHASRASSIGSVHRPAHRRAGLGHRLGAPLQRRLARAQLADPRREPPLADVAELEPEAAQDAADAEPDVHELALEQLTPDQQRPDLLRRRRLAVDGAVPAHAQELGDAARVLAVGLHDHRRQRRLDLPGLQQHRLEARPGQAGVQPLGERPGFEPDPGQRQAELAEEADQRLRLARHLRLADDPPARVDHADAAPFQGDVDPGMVLH